MPYRLPWNTPAPADQHTYDPAAVFAAGLRNHHLANTAYPLHHATTMRPYRLLGPAGEEMAVAAWNGVQNLGLYVHVPFCQARCRYCEYTVVERPADSAQAAYFAALQREFQLYRERLDTRSKTLIGFDIGGGTPALVDPTYIGQIIEVAHESFSFRPGLTISIETTPIIADRRPDKMAALYDLGIRRISMGVQTTQLLLAQAMGREYEGPSMLERAVANIRQAGFGRFNIDLMYGFAEQSAEGWRESVRQTIALGPEYVTLYRVRHKGTRIADQATRVTREQVNALEAAAHELLLAAGYAGTPGKNTYSRLVGDAGTSDYLTERVVKGTPYLGLGLGAQSFSLRTLSYNQGAASKTLAPYLQAVQAGRLPLQDLYYLPREVAMAKMISVSFYFGEIHREHFAACFGVRLEEQFAREVDFVLQNGLMEYVGPALRLTRQGVECFNGVVALFYAGAVKEYLIGLGNEQEEGQGLEEAA